MPSSISIIGVHPTLRFAARELSRHLKKTKLSTPLPTFRLGLCRDLNIAPPKDLGEDEDWIRIATRKGEIIIAGSNERSVLFATYRYLREIGFRWIRPGKRGEIIPACEVLPPIKTIEERPSYHFRTLCIEGACSFEHVRDLLDWATRHGVNGYFLQFEYGTAFWQRWYEHAGNAHWKGAALSDAEIKTLVEKLTREIEKRGLRFERMGHGWTSIPLGLPGESWEKYSAPISARVKKQFAQIDGKRALFGGTPINTNLCYSKPQARALIVESIAQYAQQHSETSHLHFWLADGSNNHCECDACTKARPSDFYVEMLNALDEKLRAQKLDTKIVFLIYVDLLWPPERTKIKNPDRFVLMFAPISRSYSYSYADAPDTGEKTKPYKRNALELPVSPRANLAYLQEWKKMFGGQAFDFDYHLLWACYYDPNQFHMAGVLCADIGALESLGMNGLNSALNQRLSFPHNLLLDVMARSLWNKKLPFKTIARESFADAFGEDGADVETFFKRMSKLWQPFFEAVYIPTTDEKRIAQGMKNIPKMRALIREFEIVVNPARPDLPEAMQWSWKYAQHYLELLPLLLDAFEAYLKRAPDCTARFEIVFDWLWKREKTLHPALDVRQFVGVLKWRVNEAVSTQAVTLAGND